MLVNRTTGVWNTGTGFERRLTQPHWPATKIRRPVFEPSLTIPAAVSTPPRAFIRSLGNTSGFYNTATGAHSLAQ